MKSRGQRESDAEIRGGRTGGQAGDRRRRGASEGLRLRDRG
jgi:hypothetical protein